MIPEEIKFAINSIVSYAGQSTDWLLIKKEILKSIKPDLRKLFSVRHPITKKQQINQFDIEVASYWENITGNTLILTQNGKSTKIT